MRKSSILFLVFVVCLAYGLTACGTSCSDSCNKASSCNFWPPQWKDGCMDFCNNVTDCGTKCSTSQECIPWVNCVFVECVWSQ